MFIIPCWDAMNQPNPYLTIITRTFVSMPVSRMGTAETRSRAKISSCGKVTQVCLGHRFRFPRLAGDRKGYSQSRMRSYPNSASKFPSNYHAKPIWPNYPQSNPISGHNQPYANLTGSLVPNRYQIWTSPEWHFQFGSQLGNSCGDRVRAPCMNQWRTKA